MVEVRNVSKSFGAIAAVRDVSFSAEPGEIFGLIGPNGAGKSTTIRMIMNILAPDSGAILFDGSPLEEDDKARIGYLPEERGLYRKVKVGAMLRYLGSLKGAPAGALEKSIDSWLARFDLTEWKDRPVAELSKGMAQKVQFIAAVAHKPDILFFDEPFSGLDPVSSDTLSEAIQEFSASGRTVLFSTHIMEQAEKLCRRIFLINKGSQVLYGPISEVKESQGTRTVVIEFDGEAGSLSSIPRTRTVAAFPRWVELELEDGARPDDVLRAVVGKVSIRKFEVVAPSLHRIFVSLVGKDAGSGDAKGGNRDA